MLLFTIAHAQSARCVAQGFLDKINDAVVFPLIALLTAVALLMFLYGGFRFVMGANNPQEREQGKKHMIYGVIGLLVMVSAYTILAIAAASFDIGLSDPNDCRSNDPNDPGSIPGSADGSMDMPERQYHVRI